MYRVTLGISLPHRPLILLLLRILRLQVVWEERYRQVGGELAAPTTYLPNQAAATALLANRRGSGREGRHKPKWSLLDTCGKLI